jgi:hypothetical protein
MIRNNELIGQAERTWNAGHFVRNRLRRLKNMGTISQKGKPTSEVQKVLKCN